MNEKMKKTAGMSMGIVIIFIMVMSVAVVSLLVVSTNALRSANRLPQMDGEFFSAEAAMNRAVPMIAEQLTTSSAAADTIQADLMVIANGLTINSTTPVATVETMLRDAIAANTSFASNAATAISGIFTGANALPGRLPLTNQPPSSTNVGSGLFVHVGTAFDSPAEGFADPAYVNLARRVGNPSQAQVDVFVEVLPLTSPAGFEFVPEAFITVISESGAVELQERISFDITPFRITWSGGSWNQNTTFNQGLGPGGFTRTNGGELIWLAGAGSGNPPAGVSGNHPPYNTIHFAYDHSIRGHGRTRPNPYPIGVPRNADPRPDAGDVAMYSAEIPDQLKTFVRTLFSSATFHPEPWPSSPVSPHTWSMTNPFNPVTHANDHAVIQNIINFVTTPPNAGVPHLPPNGHFGGMSDVPRGGMRCPYRHAIYFLMRLSIETYWANATVSPMGFGPGNSFPTATENPSGTQVWIPPGTIGVPGTGWQPTGGIPDGTDLSTWLRDNPTLRDNARYLRITNAANSPRHLHGTLSMPNLQSVHAEGSLRFRQDANFTGNSNISTPTRFHLSSGLLIEAYSSPAATHATINNAELIMSGATHVRLGPGGSLLGNAVYMARGSEFTISGSGSDRITIGATDRAPQFYSDTHISLNTVGDYHGVFASMTGQIVNPPPSGSPPATLTGTALGNYHPQELNRWVPGDDPLTANMGNGGMLTNTFELLRDIINKQGGGGGGVTAVKQPPASTGTTVISNPQFVR